MTNREIYDAALRTVCERGAVGDTEDYEERAPYLLAVLYSQLSALDAALREARGEEAGEDVTGVYVGLDEDCPLCDPLASVAVYYLSAMLVIDENEELYERLFALYTDAIASLQASFSCKPHPIVDVYGELL